MTSKTGATILKRAAAAVLGALCAAVLLVAAPAQAAGTRTLTLSLADPNSGWVHTFTITVDQATGAFTGPGTTSFNGAYQNDETIVGHIDTATNAVLDWRATYTSGPYATGAYAANPYQWWWPGPAGSALVATDNWSPARSLPFTMALSAPPSVPAVSPWHLVIAAIAAAAFLAWPRRRPLPLSA